MSPERRQPPPLHKSVPSPEHPGLTDGSVEAIFKDIELLLQDLGDPNIDINALANELTDEIRIDVKDTQQTSKQSEPLSRSDRSPIPKSPWSIHAANLYRQNKVLRGSYRNPLRETSQIKVEVIESTTDSLADSIYHLSSNKAVKTIAARPELPRKGLMNRNTTDEQFREKVYVAAARSKQAELAAEHAKLSKLVSERLYFSDSRDGTFKALVQYAELERGTDYVREEADGDSFRFYVTASGFAKLEAMSDKDNTYNLSNISHILKDHAEDANGQTDVEKNSVRQTPLRAANTLFCLHGDLKKFTQTLTQKNGGFVLACIYRGPRTNYDDLEATESDRVDHIWELEARHLHLEFMSAAIQQLRQKVRQRLGLINPVYYSPLRMKDEVPQAIEAALAIGAARTLRQMSIGLNDVAINVAKVAAQAEQESRRYLSGFKELGNSALSEESRELEEKTGRQNSESS